MSGEEKGWKVGSEGVRGWEKENGRKKMGGGRVGGRR